MRIIYVNIICGDLRRYVWRNSSIFPTIPDFQSGGVKCRTRGCRNSANKVWYWPWFVRPWSIGRTRTQYSPRVLIFSNFFFLLTYLITQKRASENWHSSRTIWSILLMKLLKIASMRFAFRANLGTPAIHRRCAGDPLHEQVAEHCHLQKATKSQVTGRRHVRTRP